MNYVLDDILMHYGVKFRSGRYPWGSGENGYQRSRDFKGRVEQMLKEGFTYEDPKTGKTLTGNAAVAASLGMTATELKSELSICEYTRQIYQSETAKRLAEKEGLGPTEIGKKMGVSESTVRGWLEKDLENAKAAKAANLAVFLEEKINEKGMLDVGKSVELELGVSKEMLNTALYMLKKEGYPTYSGRMEQVNNAGNMTTNRVLCPPGTEHKEIYNLENIHTIHEYASHDGGQTFDKLQYPASFDSKRLKIRYTDEVGPDGATGNDKDGIIELRRGVKDISLGDTHYSQVRILVDDAYYMKGMAVYADNMPDGVDIIFNTNKSKDVPMQKVLKGIKDDPENPFGALIKPNGQSYYEDSDGTRKLSVINKTRDEGDWTEWKDSLPSQFLSKQSDRMIKRQLDLSKDIKRTQFEEIMALDNPTIKKYYLNKFAEECDSTAVHLQAAALPGQKYHVIIPVNTLGDHEVYAPQYENGTKLALVRYPHGGTFEIPILTVNNKNALANSIIGNKSIDAIGINKKNADQLSGADFDGDTVMAIPTHGSNSSVRVSNREQLKELKDFDPKMAYPERPGMQYLKEENKGREMGVISNLITDMTLLGANDDELARAVKHSMVVIDAVKHKLDYKRSEVENNIAALKKEYQVHILEDGTVKYGGAATIISGAKGQQSVVKRKGEAKINLEGKDWYDPSKPEGSLIWKTDPDAYYPDRQRDKDTGIVKIRTSSGKVIKYDSADKEANDYYAPVRKIDKDTGEITFTNKDGTISYKVKTKNFKSTRMEETDDANTLVSPTNNPKERAYADYANYMKSLANQARKEYMYTEEPPIDKKAKTLYREEVASLKNKLNDALKNAVRERAANRQAITQVEQKKAANENMSKEDIKKAKQKAMSTARSDVGSVSRRNRNIEITDREWEAIQNNAIGKATLRSILNNTDPDKLRERSMPRETKQITTSQMNKIKSMGANKAYTLAEIAAATGLSTSTIEKYLKGAK